MLAGIRARSRKAAQNKGELQTGAGSRQQVNSTGNAKSGCSLEAGETGQAESKQGALAGYTLRMDAERMRALLLKLPNVVETMQWGANLVFWVGDKAIGGKMFAVVDLDGKGGPLMSYAAGPERFAELVEQEGIVPAPYLARAYWIAVERWDIFRGTEWISELEAAHAIISAKLSKRTRDVLALPAKERKAMIAQRKAAKK
jgi:predicted DNA-binding protein (MmcQ/YjbR family)